MPANDLVLTWVLVQIQFCGNVPEQVCIDFKPCRLEHRCLDLNAERVRGFWSIIPGAGVPAENLSFNFTISGQARWRPTRVYTDGAKTYIQFPGQMMSGDAPVLFVVSGGENRIVNYRLNGTMMIVDYVFDRAVLLSGVGSRQQKITISRRG